VTVGELSQALGKRLSKENSETVATKLVAIADANGNGDMSRDELKAAVRRISSGEGDELETLSFERAFEVWLRKTFLPAAKRATVKKSKK
jgi:hypothetical protein